MRHRFYLALIIILSLGLNFLGIWWGQYNADDITPLARYMLKYRTLKPYHFFYPTLFSYTVLVFSVVPEKAFGIINLLSSGHNLQSAIEMSSISNYQPPTPQEYIGPRILAAIIGTCGVYLIYRLGKFCFTARTGLLAALLMSVCMGYVIHSHFATVDVPVTVMMILAIWMCLRANKKLTAGSFALAGLTIGLAASTKYYGALLICPFLLVHIHALRKKRIFWRRLLLSLTFILIGFIAGTPYSILSFFRFAKDVLQQFISTPIYQGISLPLGYITHWKNLINILGLPLFLVTIASLIYSIFYMIRFRKFELACIWAFILPFYLIMGRSCFNPGRYILPIVPFLLLITADTFNRFLNARNKFVRHSGLAVLVAVVIYSFLYSAVADFHLILDSKRMFLMWAETNIPEGSRIELSAYCPRPIGDYSSYYRPMAGGRDRLYSFLEENKLYRLMLRHGIIWKHFLTRGKLPSERIINKLQAFHLEKEVPPMSMRLDEEFDYSLKGLYRRAPDYLVINDGYGLRFTRNEESYPILAHFFSTMSDDADTNYRKIATFRPLQLYILNPAVPGGEDHISVYKRIANPLLSPDF